MALLDKMRHKFYSRQILHEVTGRALFEGKVICYHSYKADKSHNNAIENRLIILPSDWCTIIDSSNPVSKYTVAFNMCYFMEYPDAINKFGNLFSPWLDEFYRIVGKGEDGGPYINDKIYKDIYGISVGGEIPFNAPYIINAGYLQYWVVLPIEYVWVYEIDDVTSWHAPVFTGLFKSILNVGPMEEIFLDLAQNPLIALLTAEIPYFSDKVVGNAKQDNFAISNDYQEYYKTIWEEIMQYLGTQGVGLYPAPFTNFKLNQLGDSQYTDKLLSAYNKYVVGKSGLLGVLPATDSVMAGQIGVAKKLVESFSASTIYRTCEKMLDQMTLNLNLRGDYAWCAFGGVFSDDDEIVRAEKALTLGITPDLFRYNALKDRGMFADLAMSKFVDEMGYTPYRNPLSSSYQSGGTSKTTYMAPGRPRIPRDQIISEETERTIDKSEDG